MSTNTNTHDYGHATRNIAARYGAIHDIKGSQLVAGVQRNEGQPHLFIYNGIVRKVHE